MAATSKKKSNQKKSAKKASASASRTAARPAKTSKKKTTASRASAAGRPKRVKAIPDAYRGAIPYLCCNGAANAIDFYKNAFGAVELNRIEAPGGMIGHAEVRIGDDAIVMLADEYPQMGFRSPQSIGGTPTLVAIYVPDVDAFDRRARAAGAKVLRPVADQFYGDRSVSYEDPFGHRWTFATHIEDLTPEEIGRRAAAMHGQS